MELDARDLHVWSVRLRASDEVLADFEKVLSAPEIERCRRLYHAVHQRAYAVSHGMLRMLLAQYIQIPPRQIAFRYGHAGKPALAGVETDLEFNMSHAGDMAVYAFARGCRLGVDVEQVRPMPDLELVAAHFFGAEERSELLALEPAQRTEAFFRCWTRKEAYIKAIGDGLLMPLNRFRVSLASGEPAALLHTAETAGPEWHMDHLAPAPDYVGALAYDGCARAIHKSEIEIGDRKPVK